MTTLTPRERELARRALGLDWHRKRSYRNRFTCHASTPNGQTWRALEQRGLALPWLPEGSTMLCFYLTRAGAEAALEPGEALDEEDLPG